MVIVEVSKRWLKKLSKRDIPFGGIVAVALILAGALGNIIDSVFYGVLFSHSYGQIASFLPDKGYAPLFLGISKYSTLLKPVNP